MYKIYSKLVFFLKKKSSRSASEQCKRIALFTIFNMNSARKFALFMLAINTTVQEKHVTLASSNPALQTQKVMGPMNSNNGFFFTKHLVSAFWLKCNFYRVNKRPRKQTPNQGQALGPDTQSELNECYMMSWAAYFWTWIGKK